MLNRGDRRRPDYSAYPIEVIDIVGYAYSALPGGHSADGVKACWRPMHRSSSPPKWITIAAIVLAVSLIARIISVLASGAVEPLVALRTYLFWAVVCVPVALLGDLLLRTIWNYQISQLARQRVRARRRR